jgi:DNA-binding transcriptional LysR family regulator
MKLSTFDLDALRCFVAVARLGGFTAAARELGSSKVRLSRGVTRLERNLSATLLVRTTRTVRLTEAGEVVLELAPDLLSRADGLERRVADTLADPGGRLRIVAHPLIYEFLLEPVVLPFLERYPKVAMALDVALDPVTSDSFDLALVAGPAPDSSMGSIAIGRARLGCYSSEDYARRHTLPDSPDAVRSHAIVSVGRRGQTVTWSFARAGRSHAVELKPHLTVSSHDLLLRAVARGVGIARLPSFLAARSTLPLVPVLADWNIADVPAYAVFPGRDRPPPAVRAFLDLLKAQLSRRRKPGEASRHANVDPSPPGSVTADRRGARRGKA